MDRGKFISSPSYTKNERPLKNICVCVCVCECVTIINNKISPKFEIDQRGKEGYMRRF